MDDSIRVELADSVRFENELIGVGYLRRVVVRTGAGVDTLDGVVTDQQPVAEWPSGRMIYRGVPVRMLETDVGVDAVRWLDTNSFEVRIEMSHSVGGGAQRTRGTLRGLASVVVDTIRS